MCVGVGVKGGDRGECGMPGVREAGCQRVRLVKVPRLPKCLRITRRDSLSHPRLYT